SKERTRANSHSTARVRSLALCTTVSPSTNIVHPLYVLRSPHLCGHTPTVARPYLAPLTRCQVPLTRRRGTHHEDPAHRRQWTPRFSVGDDPERTGTRVVEREPPSLRALRRHHRRRLHRGALPAGGLRRRRCLCRGQRRIPADRADQSG